MTTTRSGLVAVLVRRHGSVSRCAELLNDNLKTNTLMKNRNKFDAMLDVIEAGDTESLEQQNARHISQMKTLLDDHLAQQHSNLVEFREGVKANTAEMKKWREEMARERKVLAKTLATHKVQIDQLSSYAEGVYLSRGVYNWCLGIFVCSVIIVTALTTMAIVVWMKII